ncbi:MAG TPA: Clp protease N-terminal domain-containing protein [Verrucomicrobiae bacterium]
MTFTPRAKTVLASARHEAESRGHAEISDVHLFLGLFESGDGAAHAVLKDFSIDPDGLKLIFASDLNPADNRKEISYAPIAQQILDLASAEAASLRHDFVGTEHLLLGILKTKGQVTKWFDEIGVKPENISNRLLEQIPTGFASGPNESESPGWVRRILNLFTQPKSGSFPDDIDFTPRARQVLSLARAEAQRRGQAIDDLHLLFGLCQLGQGVAVNVMQHLGGDWGEIEKKIIAALDEIPRQPDATVLPEGPRLKTVFAVGHQEQKALYHTYFGTEHVFLGLLQAGGPAAKIICSTELDIKQVREAILRELDPNFSAGPAEDMWDRTFTNEPINAHGNEFSPRVLKALQAAQTESRTVALSTVGTLQVLAGLMTLGSGVAVQVMHRQGLTLELVRNEITAIYQDKVSPESTAPIPYTLNAHAMLEAAHQEAKKAGFSFTGAEHLLLAILRSDAVSLVDFFNKTKIDCEKVTAILLKELKDSSE